MHGVFILGKSTFNTTWKNLQMAAQKLSIVIPTYNRNEVLLKVVRRITEQTNKNFELIIIDNNSPENQRRT